MTDSALEQKAVELITNIEKMAEPAMQITLHAMRVGALVDVVLSVACLALLALVCARYIPRYLKAMNDASFDAEIPLVLGGIVAGIATAILAGAALLTLLSTSTWLAIFSPELALARALVEKAI